MNVWRLHLKTDKKGHSYRELIEYCQKKQIIGIGWDLDGIRIDDKQKIDDIIINYRKYTDNGARKATHAMMRMQQDDLIWTRLPESSAEYYLCRVGKTLWKDLIPSEEDKEYDLCQYVSAQWVSIDIEAVPGKLINSFSVPAAVQRVSDIESISKYLWNKFSCSDAEKYAYIENN